MGTSKECFVSRLYPFVEDCNWKFVMLSYQLMIAENESMWFLCIKIYCWVESINIVVWFVVVCDLWMCNVEALSSPKSLSQYTHGSLYYIGFWLEFYFAFVLVYNFLGEIYKY